jgi:hypothetical protein
VAEVEDQRVPIAVLRPVRVGESIKLSSLKLGQNAQRAEGDRRTGATCTSSIGSTDRRATTSQAVREGSLRQADKILMLTEQKKNVSKGDLKKTAVPFTGLLGRTMETRLRYQPCFKILNGFSLLHF